MPRRLLTTSAIAFSTLLCLTLIYLKLCSYSTTDYFGLTRATDSPNHYALRHLFVGSGNGYLMLAYRSHTAATPDESAYLRDTLGRRAAPLWHERSVAPDIAPNAVKLSLTHLALRTTSYPLRPPNPGPLCYERAFYLPHSYLILLTALPPLAAAFYHTRRTRRRRSNHCLTCGYDLRASPDRCPECGTPTPPSSHLSNSTITRES